MVNTLQNRVAEAQSLVQNGDYAEALAVYEQVLAHDRNNAAAIQGLAEAREMMSLVAQYDLAMQLAQEGKSERALAFLTAIQERSPGFRDIEARIEEIRTQDVVRLAFETAELAYTQRNWMEAIGLYEQVAEAGRGYQTDVVAQRLTQAYYSAGMQLITSLPAPGAGPEEAYTYLRKGKAIDETTAKMELERLNTYADGKKALDTGDLEAAINLWRALYDTRPDYLGGYLAGRLYATYLSLAARAEADGNPVYAANLYEQATVLQVSDVSGAQTRLATLRATTAPTPQPAPQAAPQLAAVVAPPPPTATPTPDLRGMIAFRTNRNGAEEIYLMQADGSQQQLAPVGFGTRFDELLQGELLSPDGSKLLQVQPADGRSDANLFIADLNLPEGRPRSATLTDFRGDEYDPAWSPSGERIAFVSNHTGNDEIWSVRADGTDPLQLTWNDWEWDKRPSWSPDGGQIVFYSNRSGWRQIWAMDSRGGTARNLSLNAYEDWDPVWIK